MVYKPSYRSVAFMFIIVSFAVFITGCSSGVNKFDGDTGFAGIAAWEGSVTAHHTIEEEKESSSETLTETGLDELSISLTLGERDRYSDYLTWHGSDDEGAEWEVMSYTIVRLRTTMESTQTVHGSGKAGGMLKLDIDEENEQYCITFWAKDLEVPVETKVVHYSDNRTSKESDVAWHEIGCSTNWHPLPEPGEALRGSDTIIETSDHPNIDRLITYEIEWELEPR